MICEACQQNLATVHLTEIVQKQKRETHLCETCAETKGIPQKESFSVEEFLGGMKKDPAPAKKVGLTVVASFRVELHGDMIGRLGCRLIVVNCYNPSPNRR